MTRNPRYLIPPFLMLFALISGCGKAKKDSDGIRKKILATPFEYSVQDSGCQKSTADVRLTTQTIETWNGSAYADEKVDFSDFAAASSDENGLASRHILGTAYGLHEQMTTNCLVDAEGNFSCDADDTSRSLGEPAALKVCNASDHFERDALEGVALASIANIERMYSKYQGVAGVKELKAGYLLVMPNIEHVIVARQPSSGKEVALVLSDTDNAAFSSVKGNVFYLIFPRSKELAEKSGFADQRLWEIPWVIGHEFSHQVFSAYYSNYKEDQGAEDDLFGTVRTRAKLIEQSKATWQAQLQSEAAAKTLDKPDLPGEKRTVDFGEALTAVNEGFADLFAQYSLSGPKGLYCFEVTRDVTNAKFVDDKAKVLDQTVKDQFFATMTEEASDNPCATSFQDVHALGAILAHGIHRLLSTGLTDLPPSKALQGRAFAWLKELDAERASKAKKPEPEGAWVMAIRAAIVVAKGASEGVPEAACQIVKDVFPLYSETVLKDFSCVPQDQA